MKKQIIIVLGLIVFGVLQAQKTGSYLNLSVGGGVHNLNYTLQDGTQKGQFGYTINAGYSYFFTPKWGLHTGLGFQSFNSLSTLNYLSSTPDIDTDGEQYIFKVNYNNWQEKQHAVFLDIPLAVQYKLPISPKIGLLTSLGAKVSFPLNSSYKTAGDDFVTTGYYSQYNVELSDMPQHGFSTVDKTFSGNIALKPSYMAIADIGGLYKLSDKLDLFVGGYINYGLNNILKPDTKLIYQPDKVYNGFFTSSKINNVTPVSVGLKVGIYLHLGDNKNTVDLLKPIDSLQPVQVTEPIITVETVQPVQVNEPVKTEEPVQPVQIVEPVKPVAAIEPVQSVQKTETVQAVEPVPEQPVAPVAVIIPAEPVKEVKAVVPVVAEQPVMPTKTEPLVLEATVAEPAPKAVEAPKVAVVAEPSKPVVTKELNDNEDMFSLAQKIAASMNVMFGFNSTRVTTLKNKMIKELSEILKANPFIHLNFVGHTCNIGTHDINMNVGMRRAINVKQKFIELGVPEAQLMTESKAYDQPLVPNTSSHNRAKNRRVEIKVLK